MWLLSGTIVACSLVAGCNVGASVRVTLLWCGLIVSSVIRPERAQALANLSWRVWTSPRCLRVIVVVASLRALWFLSCRDDVRPVRCALVFKGCSVPACCSHSCYSFVWYVSWFVSLSLLVPWSSELVARVGVWLVLLLLRVRTFCGDGDLSLLVVLSLFEREKFTLSDICAD